MNKFPKVSEYEITRNLINLKHLVFEVTDACNLNCRYCGYSSLYEGYDERENIRLPFQRAKLIIDHLYQYWKKFPYNETIKTVVVSFYGGEPLLNMTLIREVINYIDSLPFIGRSFEYGMTTNAMLLDQYMDFLAAKKFQLLISFDGDEKGQSYRENWQGENSFNRVYNNIKLLQKKHPVFFETKVTFNSVIHNRNSIDSTYQFIKKHFNKIPKFSSLKTTNICKDKKDDFINIYNNISDSIKKSPNSELLEQELFISNPQTYSIMNYIYKSSGNVYHNYSQLLINKELIRLHPTATCTPFAKKMFITVKGRILACEKLDHQYALGYVTDKEVILNCKQIAQTHNNHIFRYIYQCNICAINQSCEQCVYQSKSGNKCEAFMTDTNKDEKKNKTLSYLDKHPELYERILTEITIGE